MFKSAKQKSFILAFLIAAVFLNTFIFSLKRKMDKVVSADGLNMNLECISIAISDLAYGLKGYTGYYKVFLSLYKDGVAKDIGILSIKDNMGPEIDQYSIRVNNALKNALRIKNVASDGKHYLLREDKGLVDYYKLSFLIFGYNTQGFCYLYFFILLISVVTFFVSFFKRVDLLYFLLLFLCAHFVLVSLGILVVHNQRFLAVLSILPTFHLALLVLGKNVNNRKMFIGAIIQTFILFFSIHIRGSARYQVMFLTFLYLCALGFFFFKNVKLGKIVFNKVRLWPLIFVFIGNLLLNIHLATSMNYPYTDATSKHLFWFTIYVGMGGHPNSMSKYGIAYDDNVGFDAVNKILKGSYLLNSEMDYDLVEKVLKNETLRIIKTDPIFYIQSVLYKILNFLKSLLASEINFIYYSFSAINIMAIFLGAFFCRNIFIRQSIFFIPFVLLQLVFSSIPILISSPLLRLASEPILAVALLFYIIFALIICAILKSLSRLRILNKILITN